MAQEKFNDLIGTAERRRIDAAKHREQHISRLQGGLGKKARLFHRYNKFSPLFSRQVQLIDRSERIAVLAKDWQQDELRVTKSRWLQITAGTDEGHDWVIGRITVKRHRLDFDDSCLYSYATVNKADALRVKDGEDPYVIRGSQQKQFPPAGGFSNNHGDTIQSLANDCSSGYLVSPIIAIRRPLIMRKIDAVLTAAETSIATFETAAANPALNPLLADKMLDQ